MTKTARESELLAVTLGLLQQKGYDGLTVDDVAATAHASKATMYRRWPNKAELVLAAVTEGIRQVSVPPNTGNLRDDLLAIGTTVCEQAHEHAGTMRAVLVEVSRIPELNDTLQREFFEQRRKVITHVLHQAVERGEIDSDALDDELWDVLPGYLVYRSVIQNRTPTRRTVEALVDQVIIPGLTRTRVNPAPGGTVPYCSAW
ncbi:MAG: TetR/AcrR family transcriptional regulator [Mycobacterium sp.]|nr:TetR/AcrR family transcriptional regulator [Mycobacterium sp.]